MYTGQLSEFIVFAIGFTFIGAIIFLTAFLIVLAIRKKRSLVAALVSCSLLLGTFVVFNPNLSRRMITALPFQSREGVNNVDTFGEQIIVGLFRNADSIAHTIVFGSFTFGCSATVCGLLFWFTDRKLEETHCTAIENAKKT